MENETLWECRRCGTEYEGDTPDHDEQRLCRPDTPHDWKRMETPTPETDAETVEKVLDLFEALCASTTKEPANG
jgi:rubredoxin